MSAEPGCRGASAAFTCPSAGSAQSVEPTMASTSPEGIACTTTPTWVAPPSSERRDLRRADHRFDLLLQARVERGGETGRAARRRGPLGQHPVREVRGPMHVRPRGADRAATGARRRLPPRRARLGAPSRRGCGRDGGRSASTPPAADEPARRLGERGQRGRLSGAETPRSHLEVTFTGRFNSLQISAIRSAVQVLLQDLVLGQGQLQTHRPHRLAQLPRPACAAPARGARRAAG